MIFISGTGQINNMRSSSLMLLSFVPFRKGGHGTLRQSNMDAINIETDTESTCRSIEPTMKKHKFKKEDAIIKKDVIRNRIDNNIEISMTKCFTAFYPDVFEAYMPLAPRMEVRTPMLQMILQSPYFHYLHVQVQLNVMQLSQSQLTLSLQSLFEVSCMDLQAQHDQPNESFSLTVQCLET
jgi:hypothetical protein